MAKFFVLYLSVLLAGSCMLQVSLCQKCSELNVGNNGEAESGADLTICTTTDRQCCLQSYIDTAMEVANNKLNQELRSRLRDTGAAFNNTVNLIYRYFTVDFSRLFTRLLPNLNGQIDVNSLSAFTARFVTMITDNLVIDDSTRNLDLSEVVNDIVTALGEAAGQHLSRNSTSTQACILNAIQNSLNQTDIQLVIRAIEDIRRAFTVLQRSANFFQQYVEGLQFRFPRNCVRRFVELNFCARCTQKIPPLCSNTCGALVRGCLSAYYSALSRQFDILWDVSRQVVMITNSTLQALFFNEERQVIDQTAAFLEVGRCIGRPPIGKRQAGVPSSRIGRPPLGKRQAGVPSSRIGRPPLGKRQAGVPSSADLLPQDRIQELTDLTGRAFTYIRDTATSYQGPAICQPSAREFFFCSLDGSPVRGQNCSSGDPCSSSCRCFDGKNERMDNTEEFSVDGIEGQEDNPVIDLDTGELVEIAASVGTPISAFLMQDEITDIIPDSVKIPAGEPYGSAAAMLAVSMTILLTSAVAALFFN